MSSISVVIPALNEAELIGQCLESLYKQDLQPDEIIVVDNNSTDDTGAIVDRFAAEMPMLRRIAEPRRGAGYARSTGFDAATSDVIAKTDADALVSPEWTARIVEFFDSKRGANYAAITGPSITWDGPSGAREEQLAAKAARRVTDGVEVPGLNGPTYAVRAESWRAVRANLSDRADIWEDFDLALSITEAGLKNYYLPGLLTAISCRQFRFPPWRNWHYLTGGLRTARVHGNDAAVRTMRIDLIPRTFNATAEWLIFRPWDQDKRNWRPHRLFVPLERTRSLSTDDTDIT